MDIHEYQAKAILGRFGIAQPQGEATDSASAAEAIAARINAAKFVVKAQVLAGARGKAGGIRFVDSPEAAGRAAREMIGTTLVTEQTGVRGRMVRRVLVEQAVDHDRVLYLAVLVDRARGRVSLIGARLGGEDIEERAARDPNLIQRVLADPETGFSDADLAKFAKDMALQGQLASELADLCRKLHKAFVALDASLLEINPLAVTSDRKLVALDVKMSVDDNALFRHPELEASRDAADSDPAELEAQRYEMNYVKLDGDIGVVVNGAGLALATLDMLKDADGSPANFMDVRPEATSSQIATGFSILLSNPQVKAVLVNIYGGGLLRCDTVAEGIAMALKRNRRSLPIVFRAAGTNAELALSRLKNYGIAHTPATNMTDAVSLVIDAARRAR